MLMPTYHEKMDFSEEEERYFELKPKKKINVLYSTAHGGIAGIGKPN